MPFVRFCGCPASNVGFESCIYQHTKHFCWISIRFQFLFFFDLVVFGCSTGFMLVKFFVHFILFFSVLLFLSLSFLLFYSSLNAVVAPCSDSLLYQGDSISAVVIRVGTTTERGMSTGLHPSATTSTATTATTTTAATAAARTTAGTTAPTTAPTIAPPPITTTQH